MKEFYTSSAKETQRVAASIAREISDTSNRNQAVVIGLTGDLGSGKTTFTQGFAKELGVKEKILSPTFVIMKSYNLSGDWATLHHIDCYRIQNAKDIKELGWDNVLGPGNITLVEWPERIQDILPEDARMIHFKDDRHGGRIITIQ